LELNSKKIRKYYSIFLNTMASIIKQHNGKVIKNAGDSLIYYFPRIAHFANGSAFQDVLECGLKLIQTNSGINSYLNSHELPYISYRISANYGQVDLGISTNSNTVDLFDPAVNICSKINPLALPNEMVIYKDLYNILEKNPFLRIIVLGRFLNVKCI
jgi:class 3 adenylate cyclase